MAIQLLEEYIQWRSSKPVDFLPKSGIEGMYCTEELQKMLELLKTYDFNSLSKHKKIEALEKEVSNIQGQFQRPKSFREFIKLDNEEKSNQFFYFTILAIVLAVLLFVLYKKRIINHLDPY